VCDTGAGGQRAGQRRAGRPVADALPLPQPVRVGHRAVTRPASAPPDAILGRR
jgi:hypothetical protein